MAELVRRVLSYPGAPRVAFWLWMHPGYHTAEEIKDGIARLTLSRIQQILRLMNEKKLVDKRPRKTYRRGPSPYEYRLSLQLVEAMKEERGR